MVWVEFQGDEDLFSSLVIAEGLMAMGLQGLVRCESNHGEGGPQQ